MSRRKPEGQKPSSMPGFTHRFGRLKKPRAKKSKRDQDVHVFRKSIKVGRETCKTWVVVRLGKMFHYGGTQRNCIKFGKLVAIKFSCDLVVHGRDGKIREKNSHGSDPIRRKG